MMVSIALARLLSDPPPPPEQAAVLNSPPKLLLLKSRMTSTLAKSTGKFFCVEPIGCGVTLPAFLKHRALLSFGILHL